MISLQSLENKTVILNQTEFLPLNKNQTTFLICIISNPKPLTLTKVRKWKEDLNLAEYYLSIILVLISITFAILFIITFTLFSELRNKGNIDVFCMSMFILLSDVIYILALFLGERDSEACKVLGMLLHFALLMTGLWTISLGLDIVISFLRKGCAVKFNRKQFIFRVVACAVLALSLMTICISLNETKTIDFKYGSNDICWIGNHFPRLFFYLIPTALFFLVGIICLSSVLWYLRKQEKDQRKTLKNSGRTNIDLVTVCLKLFVLLGLAEAIGLIQIYKTDLNEDEMIFNATFGFVYTIARSIRGSLVFWMYLGNAKTLTLFKKRFFEQSEEATNDNSTKMTRVSGLNSNLSSPAMIVKREK